MKACTVVGSEGFIGRQVARNLELGGCAVRRVGRIDPPRGADLGHVFYCSGVTGDFRTRPLDTMAAHVAGLVDLLRNNRLEWIGYLSSTRVYKRCARTDEGTPVLVDPSDPDDLYEASKLAGEAACLHSGTPAAVLRLSNVYGLDIGSPNFLASTIEGALRDGRIRLTSHPLSERDYVSVDFVVAVLLHLAREGAHGVFNVASGENVLLRDVVDSLVRLTGCAAEFVAGTMPVSSPRIEVRRLRDLNPSPAPAVLDDLPALVDRFKRELVQP